MELWVPSCCPCLALPWGHQGQSCPGGLCPARLGGACSVQGEQQAGLGWAGGESCRAGRAAHDPIPCPGQQRVSQGREEPKDAIGEVAQGFSVSCRRSHRDCCIPLSFLCKSSFFFFLFSLFFFLVFFPQTPVHPSFPGGEREPAGREGLEDSVSDSCWDTILRDGIFKPGSARAGQCSQT